MARARRSPPATSRRPGCRPFRRDRPRGLLRLPGHPSAREAGGGADPADRLAGDGLLPRPARRHGPGRRAPARGGAEPALANVRGPDRGLRPRAGRRARRHAGRAARRRAAHTADAGDRQRDRPRPDRAARAPGLPLRGPDRDRRRRARRLQAGRHPVREPLGGRASLRFSLLRAPRPPARSATGSLPCSARRSTRPNWTKPRTPTSARSARRSPPTRRRRRTSRSSSGGRTSSTRATSRRASRWRRSCRASCASARRTAARAVPPLRALAGGKKSRFCSNASARH